MKYKKSNCAFSWIVCMLYVLINICLGKYFLLLFYFLVSNLPSIHFSIAAATRR